MPDLHDEITNGNVSGVRLLLEQGTKGNFSKNGISSLTVAIGNRGNREIVELLIRYGADVNKLDRSGSTPIMLAIHMGYCDLLEIFINHGANVDAPNKYGGTALFGASTKECIEPLIRAGADLNHPDSDGRTPLDLAFINKQFEQAVLLLQAGARIDDTLLSKKRTAKSAVKWLTQDAYVLYATAKNNHTMLEQKLAEGISPDVRLADTGETLLMIAATYGYLEVIALLLRYKADVNEVTPMGGRTALMNATMFKRTDTVSLLLKSGADMTIDVGDGRNVLNIAASLGYLEIVTLILRHAVENRISLDIPPAVEQARKAGHSDVVALLTTARLLS